MTEAQHFEGPDPKPECEHGGTKISKWLDLMGTKCSMTLPLPSTQKPRNWLKNHEDYFFLAW